MNAYENSLLDDMKESWGQSFEDLNNSERLWLLFSVVGSMTADRTPHYDPYAVDDCVVSACDRLHELTFSQQLGLAESLINQIRSNR